MLSRVLSTIRTEGLLAAGERVLVAVSGGPDSTALLHALARLAPRLGCSLEAASVDHRLRPEAAAEARAVAEACAAVGVPCQVLPVDVPVGRRRGESLQTAARRLRLSALQEAAAAFSCQKIALGHTADDQAETVLFRIVRGTGVAGLSRDPLPARSPGPAPAGRPSRRGAGLPAPAAHRLRRGPLQRRPAVRPQSGQGRLAAVPGGGEPAHRRGAPGAVPERARRPREPGPAAPAGLASGWTGRGPGRRADRAAGGARSRHATGLVSRGFCGDPLRTGQPAFPFRRAAAAAADGGGALGGTGGRDRVVRLADHRVDRRAPPGGDVGWSARCVWPPWTRSGWNGGWSCARYDRATGCGQGPGEAAASCRTCSWTPRSRGISAAGLPALVAEGGTGPILFVPGLRPAEEGRPAPRASRWIEVRVTQGGDD